MATAAPPPTKESVLQAMRSDLGMGRVDDLELENGCRGRTIRPGEAGNILNAKTAAPPRNVLPVANKWKAAIEKGDFDDDDAEAVKGLGRIGGGRLHALNSAPAVQASHFPAPRRPPPGLPPPGFGPQPSPYPMRGLGPFPSPGPQQGHGSPAVLKPPENFGQVTFPIPSATKRQITFNANIVQQLAGNSPVHQPTMHSLPARPRRPLSIGTSLFNAARKIPNPESAPDSTESVVYPPDPEPTEYVYKENIKVADRLAKGDGMVFLVASSQSDPGTIHIYLKGSRYLEYPVLSMCNYISSPTILCPQFKETDGVSIVTTSLVFGSQEKIVKFMKAIKTLQAREPTDVAPFAAPTKETASATKTKQAPVKPAVNEIVPSEQGKSFSDKPSGRISPLPKRDGQITHVREASASSARQGSDTTTSAPMHIFSVSSSEQKQQDSGVACDLINLSQPEETTVPKDTRCPGLSSSTYASDLGSLQFLSFDAQATSFVSTYGPDSMQKPRELIVMGSTESETSQTEVSQPESPIPTTPKKEALARDASLPVTPKESSEVTKDISVGAIPQAVRLESLQSSLLDILPTFEAMSKALGNVHEKDRETVAKAVFSKLKQKQGDEEDACLFSAEHLLRTLLVTSKKEKVQALTSLPSSGSPLRYSRREIMFLRNLAVPPPDKLFELDFLPQTSKVPAQKKKTEKPKGFETPEKPKKQENPQSSASNTQSPLSTPKRSNLKPDAKPFQPSPVSERTALGLLPQIGLFNPAIDSQAATLNSTVLSHMPITSNSINIESLTARMARLAIPSPKPATPNRGLGGSRWATTDDSARNENANRFMGIDISY